MKTHVTMYSRRNCHLCEVAKEVVESAKNEADFEYEVIFIDGDAGLEKEYGEEVPVTLINGKRHDYFKVDKARFIEAVLHPHQ
ncbi:MAG: glutaredoxin family protein [Actinomycetota bacterium]